LPGPMRSPLARSSRMESRGSVMGLICRCAGILPVCRHRAHSAGYRLVKGPASDSAPCPPIMRRPPTLRVCRRRSTGTDPVVRDNAYSPMDSIDLKRRGKLMTVPPCPASRSGPPRDPVDAWWESAMRRSQSIDAGVRLRKIQTPNRQW
jgi:hypothetical protein